MKNVKDFYSTETKLVTVLFDVKTTENFKNIAWVTVPAFAERQAANQAGMKLNGPGKIKAFFA